jgi:hypothetical protein
MRGLASVGLALPQWFSLRDNVSYMVNSPDFRSRLSRTIGTSAKQQCCLHFFGGFSYLGRNTISCFLPECCLQSAFNHQASPRPLNSV